MCEDDYFEPIELRGDESPELREALLEFDSVMKAITREISRNYIKCGES